MRSLAQRLLAAALFFALGTAPAVLVLGLGAAPAAAAIEETFAEDEVVVVAAEFFGEGTELIAKTLEKIFKKYGRPNGYITGEEISGAIGIGLRYGNGELFTKTTKGRKVYWQGPSIGFDFGGNASKVFTLVYNLNDTELLFQRFPGVDGTLYFVAGFSVNYQQSGDIILAPIRTGVGLRAGASIGYLHYTKKHSWLPL
jgi:hypothetical protein